MYGTDRATVVNIGIDGQVIAQERLNADAIEAGILQRLLTKVEALEHEARVRRQVGAVRYYAGLHEDIEQLIRLDARENADHAEIREAFVAITETAEYGEMRRAA